jgi:hypothetical protein
MQGISINFRIYRTTDEFGFAVQNRRRKWARDTALAKHRLTFSVLRSNSDPHLYGFVQDDNPHEVLQELAKTLNMTIAMTQVMPYYPPEIAHEVG